MRRYVPSLFAMAVLLTAVAGCSTVEKPAENIETVGTTGESSQTISGQCLVTFIGDTGQKYFSQQKHVVDIEGQAIELTGAEADCKVRLHLRGSDYQYSTDGVCEGNRTISLMDVSTLRVLLTCFGAAGDYYRADFDRTDDPVKNDGRWYHAIEFAPAGDSSTEVTLLESIDHGRIEVVFVENIATGEMMTGRLYNFRSLEPGGRVVPGKIDILHSENTNAPAVLIMQVQYTAFGIL